MLGLGRGVLGRISGKKSKSRGRDWGGQRAGQNFFGAYCERSRLSDSQRAIEFGQRQSKTRRHRMSALLWAGGAGEAEDGGRRVVAALP